MSARGLPRLVVLVAWVVVVGAFWLGVRRSEVGPLEYLVTTIEAVTAAPWAALALLASYLLRPLLLVPITVLNLATGYVLGVPEGVAVALAGTLASASIGYGLGRGLGPAGLADDLARRWPFVRLLRRRGFESVVAGGLMYLHADMVNLPAGLLRIRFPLFLCGIALGNALTMTTAVLAGASVDGGPADASVRIEPLYVVVALCLFLVSLGLAYLLRRRFRPMT